MPFSTQWSRMHRKMLVFLGFFMFLQHSFLVRQRTHPAMYSKFSKRSSAWSKERAGSLCRILDMRSRPHPSLILMRKEERNCGTRESMSVASSIRVAHLLRKSSSVKRAWRPFVASTLSSLRNTGAVWCKTSAIRVTTRSKRVEVLAGSASRKHLAMALRSCQASVSTPLAEMLSSAATQSCRALATTSSCVQRAARRAERRG